MCVCMWVCVHALELQTSCWLHVGARNGTLVPGRAASALSCSLQLLPSLPPVFSFAAFWTVMHT